MYTALSYKQDEAERTRFIRVSSVYALESEIRSFWKGQFLANIEFEKETDARHLTTYESHLFSLLLKNSRCFALIREKHFDHFLLD